MGLPEKTRSKTLSKICHVSVQTLRELARDQKVIAERDYDDSWIFDTKSVLDYFGVVVPEETEVKSGSVVYPFHLGDFEPEYDEPDGTFFRFIDDSTFQNEVLGKIVRAKKTVCISTGILRKFQLTSTKDPRAKIQFMEYLNMMADSGIVVRFLYSDVSEGMDSLLDSIKTSSNFKIIKCVRNHAKIVIVDDEFAYVGSANITRAGIGQIEENKGNFECGAISNDPVFVADALKYFDFTMSSEPCHGCHRKSSCEYY